MMTLEKALCTTLESLLAGQQVRIPIAGQEILDVFMLLSRSRSWHHHGPNPITWEAIEAWADDNRRLVPTHQAAIIMAMDGVWLHHTARRMAEQSPAMPRASLPFVSGSYRMH